MVDTLINILFIILSGIIWAWRGWTKPKFVRGYFRAGVTALVIVGVYSAIRQEGSVQYLWAILCLTILETVLGYGRTTQDINKHSVFKYPIWEVPDVIKEEYVYLGLISMCYYLLPYLIIHRAVNLVNVFIIIGVGFTVYPLAKYLELRVFQNWQRVDSWKCVEFMLGMGFGLWLIK